MEIAKLRHTRYLTQYYLYNILTQKIINVMLQKYYEVVSIMLCPISILILIILIKN